VSNVIITETRLEKVKYTYEYEGTIEQAKQWFVDNGFYGVDSEEDVVSSELETVDYKEIKEKENDS
jgi:hypothetical protein